LDLGHDRVEVPVDQHLLARIGEVREELAEAGPDRVRRSGDFTYVALPRADADVLRDILITEKAQVVIEVGLAYGVSGLAVAEAVVGAGGAVANHLIIDPFQDHFHDSGWNALVRAGLDSVCTLLRERSQIALPRLLSEGFIADAAFVDGSHIFHNVFVDLALLRDLVRPGGLIILDDCDLPSVATAVSYFELNTAWLLEPIARQTRIRAYRLPSPPVEPSFEDFKPFGLA
jgi:predicted O-methyltransferase YrrM